MLEHPTLPHLRHGNVDAGHAATCARRAVTTLVRDHAPRAVPAGGPCRLWAGSSSGLRASLCRGHGLGRASLCVGHWAEFRPNGIDLYFLFSEYIQILVNSKICVGFI
jgi:hypothetical protein